MIAATETHRSDFLDAKQVQALTGWSETTTKRFFRDHFESAIEVPGSGGAGGKKRLLALSALPLDTQARYLETTGQAAVIAGERQTYLDARAEWLSTLPDWSRQMVTGRVAAIDAWLQYAAAHPGRPVVELRQEFCAGKAFSAITLWRWLRESENGENYQALASGYGNRRGQSKLTTEEIDELVAYYCDPRFSRRSVEMAHAFHEQRRKDAGREAAKYSTIRRLLDRPAVKILKYAAQFGWRKALEKYGPYITRSSEALFPGQAYVSDHVQSNVPVIWDDQTIVYPWLCDWMDWKSRAIVGWACSKTPDTDSVKYALKMSLVEWGIPLIGYTDNGKVFKSRQIAGATRSIKYEPDKTAYNNVYAALKMQIVYAIPYNARGKAILERWHRFLADRLWAGLPGNRGRNTQERPEHAYELIAATRAAIAEKKELGWQHGTCLTRAEFEAIYREFLAWYNFERPSKAEGLDGRAPIEIWRESNVVTAKSSPAALWMLFQHTDLVRVDNQRVAMKIPGVKKPIEWTSSELAPHEGKQVTLRYDPDDLSVALCHHPQTDALICAAARVQKFNAFDAADTTAAAKLLGSQVKSFKKQIQIGKDAAEGLRDLELYRSVGMPAPDATDPAPGIDPDTIAPVRTGFEKIGREAVELVRQVRERQRAVNDDAPPEDEYYFPPPMPSPAVTVDDAEYYPDYLHQTKKPKED